MAGCFFMGVKYLTEWVELSSDEHFSIDSTHCWMPGRHAKALCAKMAPTIRRMTTPAIQVGTSKGEKCSNATHESATDLGAHLARKSDGDASRLCHMEYVLMENRNGLV
ncbi:hypothetical protein SAMN05421754_10258 [Nitrosomonas sp. Nm58]|nr:hypothetical protein SAMN05421754_10258 [Nitrosomonas sp. Nm58]